MLAVATLTLKRDGKTSNHRMDFACVGISPEREQLLSRVSEQSALPRVPSLSRRNASIAYGGRWITLAVELATCLACSCNRGICRRSTAESTFAQGCRPPDPQCEALACN
eukprot:1545680-Amphidinium_carterae.6